jgi:lambda repressor-like predicted transcriptional regulator
MVNENKHISNRKLIIFTHPIRNQRRLARALNYTPQAINHAINGGHTYRINRQIADFLGVAMVSFWPELYDNLSIQSEVSHGDKINDSLTM